MRLTSKLDAVVVGSGPNGLSAAIQIARAGFSVLVLEAKETPGGGCRSAELTLPGFVHDICATAFPLAIAGSAFRGLPLQEYGVEFVQPEVAVAHPFDDGTAVAVSRGIAATTSKLGRDGAAWRKLYAPLDRYFEQLIDGALGPLRIPRHPLAMARFGLGAIRPAKGLAEARFATEQARAVFAGLAAHSMLPLETRGSAAAGLVLGMTAQRVGWPFVRGGSQGLADGLAAYLEAIGGQVETGRKLRTLADIPPARVVLFDLTPRQVSEIAGEALPARYRAALGRYRYGMGVFKMDFALGAPVPWVADACQAAGTVHLGGTLDEIAFSGREAMAGRTAERPFVLLAQPSLFDDSRAPAGKHTAWAYCHVPNGSTKDMTGAVTAQIERFAPGFRDVVLTQTARTATEMERYNANYVGGDINGGIQDLRQLFARPVARRDPYSTPNPRLFICSSSTPPGGGVHGLCGYYAARSAIGRLRQAST
ncbi:MAG: NAD(P)/FAD-dependent oxidoreductase [Dehalococcoidia bacterium]|nr:NAD(P)/FAD-dependent oxidoreductase [Dehalococcoidia bacterium]